MDPSNQIFTPSSDSSENTLKSTSPEEVQRLVNAAEERIKKSQTNAERRLNRKIEEQQTRAGEIIVIFVGFFTFISANISIFTRVPDIRTAAWFMTLMSILLIIIISFSLFFLNAKRKQHIKIVLFTIGVLVLVGVVLFSTQYDVQLIKPVASK